MANTGSAYQLCLAVIVYWVKVVTAGTQSPYVDGVFTDDPGGFGQEHPSVQSAVQLSNDEIAELQLGTQRAWTKALQLLTDTNKYIAQVCLLFPSKECFLFVVVSF